MNGEGPAHAVAFLGEAVHTLDGVRDVLRERGVAVARGIEVADLDDTRPLSALVVAERFTPGMDVEQWWDTTAEAARALDALTDRWDVVASVLIVGYGPATDVDERADVRETLSALVARIERTLGQSGVDATVNAVEVAPGADAAMLRRRLAVFLRKKRTLLVGGQVVPHERLAEGHLAGLLNTEGL